LSVTSVNVNDDSFSLTVVAYGMIRVWHITNPSRTMPSIVIALSGSGWLAP
jgi:hypothetical protein